MIVSKTKVYSSEFLTVQEIQKYKSTRRQDIRLEQLL